DVDQLARVVLLQACDRLSLPAHLPGARAGEPAEDAQQARLATAVRARDAQQLARGEDEGNRAEQGPRAALAFELRRFEHASIVAESSGLSARGSSGASLRRSSRSRGCRRRRSPWRTP